MTRAGLGFPEVASDTDLPAGGGETPQCEEASFAALRGCCVAHLLPTAGC